MHESTEHINPDYFLSEYKLKKYLADELKFYINYNTIRVHNIKTEQSDINSCRLIHKTYKIHSQREKKGIVVPKW